MTVAALTPVATYLENGVTLAFPAPFRFLPGTLLVQRQYPDLTIETLVPGTEYAVSGGETDAGGTVTLTLTVAGAELLIFRNTPVDQEMDYDTADTFPAESHEEALDKLTMIAQERDSLLNDIANRALMVPRGETIDNLPPADVRAQGLLGFDANGEPLILPSSELGSIAVTAQRREIIAAAGQTTFQTNAQYTVGYLGVYVNGVRLSEQEFVASDGINVVLFAPVEADDVVLLEGFLGSGTATEAGNIPLNQGGSVQDAVGWVTPEMFGAKGDGSHDDTAAFEHIAYYYAPQLEAVEARLGPKVYRLTRQIIPARQVNWRGAGEMATVLLFENVTLANPEFYGAITLCTKATIDHYGLNTTGKAGTTFKHLANGAASSIIEDLQIVKGAGCAATMQAVHFTALANLRRVYAEGCGIYGEAGNRIDGTGTLVGSNCNVSRVIDCSTRFSAQHGFYMNGTDANIINIKNCNAFQSVGRCFFDASFLGNNYDGCHADGGVNAYKSISPGNTNRTVFSGCYAEGNQVGAPATTWDCASGTVIISPIGTFPVNAGNNNYGFTILTVSGFYSNSGLTITDSPDNAFGMGDATHPASRLEDVGVFIKGDNGKLFGIKRSTIGTGAWISNETDAAIIMNLALGAAIADAAVSAAAPTKAEFDALVGKVNTILARMRAKTPNILT